MNKSRLQFTLSGNDLRAFYAIAGEFSHCGKAGTLGLVPNAALKQRFRFNDADFLCVYKTITLVMTGIRYPNQEGLQYQSLRNIRQHMERVYLDQRSQTIPG
jgi:hypothetical protein